MAQGDYSIWIVEASKLAVSGGKSLSGLTQGTGEHLLGETIRLEENAWLRTDIRDPGSDTTFDDNDGGQRLAEAQVINGVAHAANTRVEAEYRLTLRDPESGETWDAVGYNLNEPGAGPAYGTVEGLAFVDGGHGFPPLGRDLQVEATAEGPGAFGQPAIEADEFLAPLCFAAGTRIAVPGGTRPVERLRPGALVITRDGQEARVRACLRRTVHPREMAREPRLRPVRIRAGALGAGLPLRDLRLSRQHRLVVSSPVAARMFGTPEVLVAAVRLVDLPGVRLEAGRRPVTYVHLVLDRHEILLAEGAPSESFLAGQDALGTLTPAARAELALLFPELAAGAPVPARRIPDRSRQRRLIRRHRRNRKPLLGDARA